MMSANQLFSVLPLYDANMQAVERTIVNQGGTASGKTYSIMQVLFTLGMQEQRQVITVVGQDIPNLKVGAYRDAKTILDSSQYLREWYPTINEGERIIKCINGSIIEFKSYKDAQDAKNGKRDYLFVNEANGIPYDVYWQLAIRTRKKVFLDYNPSARFWVHDELIGRQDTRLIISDHRRNYFLSEEEHYRIEHIEDAELWKVYARGLTGKIEGLVLTNWELCDSLPPQDEWKWSCYGMDFGFTCFKGNTLIMTSKGEVPIRDVMAGDYVLTRKGYRRVKRNIFKGYKKVIHKKFVDGLYSSDIFCTFEHNFNANGIWKKYGELTKKDKLYVLSNSMAWSLGDTLTANTKIISTTKSAGMGNINKSFSTSTSMRRNMESCPKAWSCIIKISILLTIMLKTLWQLVTLNICASMLTSKGGISNTKKKSQKEDTQRRTGKSVGRKCYCNLQQKEEYVNGVEMSLHQPTPISVSAQSNVTTNGNIKHQRIISKLCANIVEKLSKAINTLSQNVVVMSAPISYRCVSDIITINEEMAFVYDLEIEDVHEYFANGILVHNCDPTALEQVVYAHGDIWIDEKIYSTGLTNPDIVDRAKGAGLTMHDHIIADCAEPKSIRELGAYGLWVSASTKGADSIVLGLDILKRYRMHVTRHSAGIISNLRAYKWDKDRDGHMTNKPEDKNNHGIDAIRYVALDKLRQRTEVRGVRRRN